jgi:hypothetical protein
MFNEDLDGFLDVVSGFAVDALLVDPALVVDPPDDPPYVGVAVKVILDKMGRDELGLATEEPSALIKAAEGEGTEDFMLTVGTTVAGVFVPGVSYAVRKVAAEPPDGAFVRLTLARLA